MNKMHTLTKIVLSAIGIFFAIRLLSPLSIGLSYFYSKPSLETAGALLFSLSLTAAIIIVLLYIFVYKREKLAQKIVGSEQLPEPDSQIQWLPVALRLICVAGGIYFIFTVLWRIIYIITQYAYLKAQKDAHTLYSCAPFNAFDILPCVITLICGIYLLYGAPHFVRWQTKKTLQQCATNKQQ
jgi:hypothetical protein